MVSFISLLSKLRSQFSSISHDILMVESPNHILLLSLDFLHQLPQIRHDEIEHAVLDAIDSSEEVPDGVLAQHAAF